jgi:hypothetical protein
MLDSPAPGAVGSIAGLAPATIWFDGDGTTRVMVKTGPGTMVSVRVRAAPKTINGQPV